MVQETKPKVIRGFIFNIKILSNERKGEEILLSLFETIYTQKLRFKVNRDREATLRTQFHSQVGNQQIVYGKLTSAIDLSNTEWLNLQNMETEVFDVPEYLRASIQESDYVLIPKAHRMFLAKEGHQNISNNQARKFLLSALKRVIETNEEVEVIIEKDSEGIKQILEASLVEKLEISISRSNNDINEDAKEWVEGQLDEINSSHIDIKFVAKETGRGINLDNQLVNGSLGLAASNGKAVARIIDEDGHSKKISTTEYEKQYTIPQANEDSRLVDIVNRVMNLFR